MIDGNARRRLVDRALALHPDSYHRVLRCCLFAADDIDIELHAAQIVLAAHGWKK